MYNLILYNTTTHEKSLINNIKEKEKAVIAAQTVEKVFKMLNKKHFEIIVEPVSMQVLEIEESVGETKMTPLEHTLYEEYLEAKNYNVK